MTSAVTLVDRGDPNRNASLSGEARPERIFENNLFSGSNSFADQIATFPKKARTSG